MPQTRAPRRLVAPLLVCLAFAGLVATTGIIATSLAAGQRKAKASTASSTLRFGLADYEARTFSDPRVRELGVYLVLNDRFKRLPEG